MPKTKKNMRSNQLLNPQFAEIKIQLDSASKKAVSIINGISLEQLNERPQADKWSIAECFVHLIISNQEELKVLNDAYQQTQAQRTSLENHFKMDVLGRFLKWMLEPPPDVVIQNANNKTISANQSRSVERSSTDVFGFTGTIKASVDAVNGLPLDHIKVISPFNTKIKYNLLSCFSHIVSTREAAFMAGRKS